jgi:hypothetical protein
MHLQNCEKQLVALSWLSVHLCIFLNEKTQLLLDGFSLNLISEYFSKICCKYLSLIKNQTIKTGIHVKTKIHC